MKFLVLVLIMVGLSGCAPSDSMSVSGMTAEVEKCKAIQRSATVLIDRYGYYREVICLNSYSNKQ